MSKLRIYIAIALGVLLAPQALCENYPIRGRVIDRLTRRGAEDDAAGREYIVCRAVEDPRGHRGGLFALQQPHAATPLCRADDDPCGLFDAPRDALLGIVPHGRLHLARQPPDGVGRSACRRVRLLGADGALLDAALAARVGVVCAERQLVCERRKRYILPAAAIYGPRIQGCGGCACEPLPEIHARGILVGGCGLPPSRPPYRDASGLLQGLW